MDKLVKAATRTRVEMWAAFKASISIPGYGYYKPPDNIKYRFPAPGSCSLDVGDRHHLYKNDWKLPYRVSDHNIRPIELVYEEDDPRN